MPLSHRLVTGWASLDVLGNEGQFLRGQEISDPAVKWFDDYTPYASLTGNRPMATTLLLKQEVILKNGYGGPLVAHLAFRL